ncbi:MAG: GTP cyclohydrolase I FolE [Candidatus Krumholzibacteria bacterium]|nr:GTP cyclohydrolase I FolE [Candidatus Krumholzibacteria bacterium]MDH4337535.1 GTP cyclohydrolase I FolE [Candidatus Krumholzibacteria bacterium]MDH5269938.1 GTP cyclohydrolase I FolE [Candidatus Krumholzibacteria bacterium]
MARGKPVKQERTVAGDPLQASVRAFLKALDRDPDAVELRETPARVAEAWRFFTQGYGSSAKAVFAEGVFEDAYDGMVLVRDIDFFSVCEHHLVPFFGKCSVAYVPAKRVAGLSKIARLVEVHARRLQVQERMTREIARDLQTHLKPRGVAVRVEARHLCMAMRGVEQVNSDVVTTHALGVFKTDPAMAEEFRAALR